MSESLSAPWILKYYTSIAEKYGANVQDASRETNKRKKVQIIQFLTFPRDENPDDSIWARISDKHFTIPIRITNEAMVKYNRNNNVYKNESMRLTTRRFANTIIMDYKPLFVHVPLPGGKGMDSIEHIALEINDIEVLGSEGEGLFGSPRELEQDEDIAEWIAGLRQGGNAGDVLKLAKEDHKQLLQPEQRLATSIPNAPIQLPPVLEIPKVDETDRCIPNLQTGKEKAAASNENVDVHDELQEKANISYENNAPVMDKNPLKEWQKSWQLAERLLAHLVDIPEEIRIQLDQIQTFGLQLDEINDSPVNGINITEPDKRNGIDVKIQKDRIQKDDNKFAVGRDSLTELRNDNGEGTVVGLSAEEIELQHELQADERYPSTPSSWGPSENEDSHDGMEVEASSGADQHGTRWPDQTDDSIAADEAAKSGHVMGPSSIPPQVQLDEPERNSPFTEALIPVEHQELNIAVTLSHQQPPDKLHLANSIANVEPDNTSCLHDTFPSDSKKYNESLSSPLLQPRNEHKGQPKILALDSDMSGTASQHTHNPSQSQAQSGSQAQSQLHTLSPFQDQDQDPSQIRELEEPILKTEQKSRPLEPLELHGPQLHSRRNSHESNSQSKLEASQTQSESQPEGEGSDPFNITRMRSIVQALHPKRLMSVLKSRTSSTEENATQIAPEHSQEIQAKQSVTENKSLLPSHVQGPMTLNLDADDAVTHETLQKSQMARRDGYFDDQTVPGWQSLRNEHMPSDLNPNDQILQQKNVSATVIRASPSHILGKRHHEVPHPGDSILTTQALEESESPGIGRKKMKTSSVKYEDHTTRHVKHDPKAWQIPAFMQKNSPLEVQEKRSSPQEGTTAAIPIVGRTQTTMYTKKAKISQSQSQSANSSSRFVDFSGPHIGHKTAELRRSNSSSNFLISKEAQPEKANNKLELGTPAEPLGKGKSFTNEHIDQPPLRSNPISDISLLRREPGGPQWLSWKDISDIMLKVERVRHPEGNG